MMNGHGTDSSVDLNASDRYAWDISKVINLRGYFIFIFILKKQLFHLPQYYDITNELFW